MLLPPSLHYVPFITGLKYSLDHLLDLLLLCQCRQGKDPIDLFMPVFILELRDHLLFLHFHLLLVFLFDHIVDLRGVVAALASAAPAVVSL